MKRASVSFNQSHAIDDEGKTKFKYQTLLNEYLEMQKEYVSKKRKLQAAKQKRETLLSEVRFLRQRRKYLLKSQAPNVNKEPLQLPSLDSESNTLHSGRNQSAPKVAPKSFDQVLVSNCRLKSKLGEEYDKDVRVTKKQKNNVLQDKGARKRKICWPDQVTLKV